MFTKIKMLSQNTSFMKYLKNSSWMLAEYMLRVISAIFVSIYIARYLGPEQFGLLSYALAIVAIFMAICRMGMESILVRDLTSFPDQARQYMGTAFYLMLLSAILGFVILSIMLYSFEGDTQTRFYVLIVALGLIFQAFLVIDYDFQAQVKAKYSSIAKSLALAVSSGIKIYLVLMEAELIAFVVIYAFYAAIVAVMLFGMHIVQKQKSFLRYFNKGLILPLLQSAWPMTLTAASAVLYMKIDQIMIQNMLGSSQLGIYAAAVKIYEGWIMLPYILTISLLPMIVKLKKSSEANYELRLIQLFRLLFWSSAMVAFFITIFGENLLQITFGIQYISAYSVLVIMMWSSVFMAIGNVSVRYLTVEGKEKNIAYRTIVALIINVVLNLVLIPILGIEGAAIATLISVLSLHYLINFINPDLLKLRQLIHKGIMFF